MTTRSLRGLLLVLLLIRTVLFLRAAAWAPVDYVGDYANDYFPRAQFLAEHGRLPRQGEVANDLYLRPPGTSVLLALPVAAGLDWQGVINVNRVANVLIDAALLAVLLWWLSAQGGGTAVTLAVGSGLLLQPWTAGFVLLPGSDTLNLLALTIAVMAAAAVLTRPSTAAAWRRAGLLGLAMAVSLLLRGESIAWLGLLAFWSGYLLWREGRAGIPALLGAWVPVIAALALGIAYSSYVRGDPNLWRTDHQSFAENGVNRWLRTWPGDELTKTNIAFYWFRGLHLSMDYVPDVAIRQPDHAERIHQALMQSPHEAPMPEAVQAQFAQLAADNRAREPWIARLWVPLVHLQTMLMQASAYPEVARLLDRVAPGLGQIVLALLRAGILVGLLLLVLHWRRLRDRPGVQLLVLIAAGALLARMGLFAILLNYPENRYLLPCWPLLLMLSAIGWLTLAAPRRPLTPV
ncbi:MAG: hypothetical protein U1F26_17375 [Lysobacterales bacterium]